MLNGQTYKPLESMTNQQEHKSDGFLDSKGKDDRDSPAGISKHINPDTIIVELHLSSARG